MDVETLNKFLVGSRAGGICIMSPPLPGQLMPVEDALNLAAYLVCLASDDELWEKTLRAVQNT